MIKMMDSNMSSISSCFCYSTWKESALPALIWIGFEFWTMVRLKNKNHVFTTPILLLWWLVSVDLEFQVIWCQLKSNALKLITYKLKPSLRPQNVPILSWKSSIQNSKLSCSKCPHYCTESICTKKKMKNWKLNVLQVTQNARTIIYTKTKLTYTWFTNFENRP